MKKRLFWIVLLGIGVAQAAIYMQHDQNGNITYSDTPESQNATPINLPASQSVTERMPPPVTSASAVAAGNSNAYTTFLITSPKDQETIQNQPVLAVDIQLVPDLQPGDSIQMYIDSKPAGNPSASTHIELENVTRGAHQLTAVIRDQNHPDKQESNTVTIFFHRSPATSPARQSQS